MDNDTIYHVNNLFEQPWWLDTVSPGLWKEFICEDKGEIVGRWPLCFKDKTFKEVTMPPLTQTSGIWIKEDGGRAGNEDLGRKREIIDNLVSQLNEVKSMDIALDSSMQYFLPFYWKGYRIEPRISYRIEDLKDLDKIYNNFSKTVKKNIKSAVKKVNISEECSVDTLFNLLEKSFLAQGRRSPISKNLIERVVKVCEKRNAGKMFTAVGPNGEIHASSYFVFDKKRCYYLISGSDAEYRTSGAQTLILWKAIQFASGITEEFDFEGSMVDGIETFFRRFGGEPTVYYHISKQNLKNEIYSVLKPRIKRLIGYKI